MNRRTPQIHSTGKLHKQDKPMRLVVNWKDNPGYKLAKHKHTVKQHITIAQRVQRSKFKQPNSYSHKYQNRQKYKTSFVRY
jgi:hypothetical protein